MQTNLYTLLLLATLIVSSCTTKSKESEQEINTEIDSLKVSPEEVVESDSVAITIEAEDTLAVLKEEYNLDKIEKIEAIRPITSLFANPLPGLSKNIIVMNIPSEEEIGIKSYPNSYVIHLEEKTEYKGKFYVSMELASMDSVEQILAFYKEEADHWYHVDKNGIHTFKKDEHKYFRDTNTLQILPLDKILHEEVDSLLGYKAKSLIRIYYEIMPHRASIDSKTSENLAYATPVYR